MRLRRPFIADRYGQIRRRMIEETELALFVGLQFPEHAQRIPTMEIGEGRFHPAFAARFWQEVLDLNEREVALLRGASAGVYESATTAVERFPRR